jgi:lysophospholipase L1-like esterase
MPHVTGRAGLAGVAVLAAVLVSAIVQSFAPARPAAAATVAVPAAATWTGTWSASPQGGSTTFRQQTLRQIAHTSISGAAARVQLSNAYSGQPVTISDIHIARRTSGSSVDTSTDRTATFGGSTSVTIPAGGTAVSDSIGFAVPALSDVAVSFYLPQQTGGLTWHQSGNQTNYIASGDVSGNGSLSGAQTTGSYYVLANLDVMNAATTGAVVTLGASITDGIASASDTNRRWPNDLAVRLNNSGRTVGVLNQGISGNKLLSDGAGQSALNRFSRDAVNQPGVRWVIFSDDPINDLGSGNQPSADQLINGLKQLIAQAHQAGLAFLCSTLTPFQGSGGWTQQGENSRGAINAFVRGTASGCDGVVDQDTATHDPANPTRYLPSLDAGDHLHPNEAGLQAIANAVNLNLFGPAQTATVISLRAQINGKFVTAGTAPLIADATAIGAPQQFDELDAGNGNIALRAHANNQIVCAEQAGAQPLIANRTAIGSWETFQLIHNSDGSVTLRAVVNNRYVTAEQAGAQALIANRTAIGSWEKFDLVIAG